ncbi:periplasmic murein peptide-binding protein MppA, partial [mine drainage metagenome]
DNPAYEQPLVQAQHSAAGPARMALFERAERALGARMPYIPLYFYTADSLVKPWVRGWYPNLMDLHPARYITILQHTEH